MTTLFIFGLFVSAIVAISVRLTVQEFKEMGAHPERYPDQITAPEGSTVSSYLRRPS